MKTQSALRSLPRLPYIACISATFQNNETQERLARWFQAQAEAEVIEQHLNSPAAGSSDGPLWGALFTGRDACVGRAKQNLEHLIQNGGLLFAWAGTSALTTEGGVA